MPYTIYALKDPRTDDIRYIGATQSSLFIRLEHHMNDANREDGQSPRIQWLRELVSVDLEARIEEVAIVDTSDPKEAGVQEQLWIEHYEEQGCDLLNVNRGGGGLSRDNRGSPSAWAICRFENTPDKIIAEHEGVSIGAVANWRKERGYMSYGEKNKLFSSICPEVANVVSTWDDIVREKTRLEAEKIPGCSVYGDWIDRLKKSIESTRDVELLRNEGFEKAIAAYSRSLIRVLKDDMMLTGHRVLMDLGGLWEIIWEQQQIRGDDVTTDDFDAWLGQLVASKRAANPDIHEYERVTDMHDRLLKRLREERKAHEGD